MKTAEKIIIAGDEKYHYSAGYYTANHWLDNDTIILSRSTDRCIGEGKKVPVELVSFSVSTGEMKVLCDDIAYWANYIIAGKTVYYSTGKEIMAINMLSGEKSVLCENADESFETTEDGSFLSHYRVEGEVTHFSRTNLKTGETEEVYKRSFAWPHSIANHWMINPQNPDLFFFAHEGPTTYISNRLWIYDMKTGKDRHIAKQRLDENGNLIDCFGHEMWARDGKGLYFVKYSCSPDPNRGICYVDAETNETSLLYSKFKYWHVGVSPDGRYLLSDTQFDKDTSEVIVIDREDNSETKIDSVKTDWVHPLHPHPQMSHDSSKVAYTASDENGRICVKIAFLK